MEAKDTVMKDKDILKLCEENPLLDFSCVDDYLKEFNALALRQAKISFKAGIKEVVELIEEQALAGELWWCGSVNLNNWDWWQAFKKSKGIE